MSKSNFELIKLYWKLKKAWREGSLSKVLLEMKQRERYKKPDDRYKSPNEIGEVFIETGNADVEVDIKD